MPDIIVMDGPAKSGKGTIAALLANHLGYVHMDSGNHYRAVAALVIETGLNPALIARSLRPSDLKREDLRNPEVEKKVAELARNPEVREAVNNQLRWKAEGLGVGVIIDGRAGALEFPEASVKIYLASTPEVRAKRYYDYLLEKGKLGDLTPEQVLSNMHERDEYDYNREVSPLVRNPGPDLYHHVIDNSLHGSPEATLDYVLAVVRF